MQMIFCVRSLPVSIRKLYVICYKSYNDSYACEICVFMGLNSCITYLEESRATNRILLHLEI